MRPSCGASRHYDPTVGEKASKFSGNDAVYTGWMPARRVRRSPGRTVFFAALAVGKLKIRFTEKIATTADMGAKGQTALQSNHAQRQPDGWLRHL